MDATFFDPSLAELQRQLQHQLTTGLADINLNAERLGEDALLMRPFMQRRFAQQMDTRAGEIAERGFHGNTSGIMRRGLSRLGEDQAFQAGSFERDLTRKRDDLARAAQQLTDESTRQGAEGVRKGAGNATKRTIGSLPF